MMPSYLLTGIPGVMYYLYYKTYCRKVPEICGGEGTFLDFLRSKCTVLQEEYRPTPFIHGNIMMTVLSSLTRHWGLNYPFVREIYVCDDGGEVTLDWWDPKFRETAILEKFTKETTEKHVSEMPSASVTAADEISAVAPLVLAEDDAAKVLLETPETAGVVLILPGLTGNSTCNYVRGLVQVSETLGLTTVVMNYRGISNSLKTPRSYCAADTSDVEAVINHIKTLYPNVPLVTVGVSLGGVLLINYLARCGANNQDSRIVGGFAVSPPWNIAESCRVLEQPLNCLIFNRHLARDLCAAVERHSAVLASVPAIDFEDLKSVQTIKQFDEKFTAKMFGYSGADEYYVSASIHSKVHQIKTPLLSLNAADDMFSPVEAIPKDAARENPNVCIAITSHGGHIGFLEGWNPFGTNYVERLFSQYVEALLTKQQLQKS